MVSVSGWSLPLTFSCAREEVAEEALGLLRPPLVEDRPREAVVRGERVGVVLATDLLLAREEVA